MTERAQAKAPAILRDKKDLLSLYQNIQAELEKVEASLQLFTASANPLISEISTYLFQKKGKRIRPALLILCSRLVGYEGDDHILTSALVEFIHTASLIHDDIIDKADRRRGRESVHTRWGPNISVLLGDYLYIKSIGLALESRQPRIVRILTDISSRMIEGELAEYYLSGNLEIAEQQYLDIIQNKTASLFSASCQIGGILGGASPDEENRLAGFGRSLGMTFQIIDDLLDFKGDSRDMGKPTLSDISEGRFTLPLIYTLSQDGHINRRRLRNLLAEKNMAETAKREILEIIRSNGALEYTFQKAESYSFEAREIISRFPASTHREALSLLAEFILTREK
jgi:octaprenyl-diphosphate synthase